MDRENGDQMSVKRVQILGKDGGAHETTQEQCLLVKIGENPILFDDQSACEVTTQNGGHIASISKSQLNPSVLEELVTPGLDLESSIISIGNQNDNNTDGKRNLIQFFEGARELGIIYEGEDTPSDSVIWTELSNEPAIELQEAKLPVEPNQQAARKSLLVSNVVVNPAFLTETSGNQGGKESKPDMGVLSIQDRACLEELERGSQLSHEEKELFENSCKELEALEYQEEKAAMISTQELESLEFDNTITDKTESRTEFESIIPPDSPQLGTVLLNGNEYVTANNSSPSSSLNATAENIPATTISIATNKETQTTQIIVQTPQGQQAFQVNTADLSQATAAIQNLGPIGLRTDVGEKGGALQEMKFAPNGLSIQDGFLMIPVQGDQTVEKKEKSWPCTEPGCDKVFNKPSKLKIHQMSHSGERPFKCEVDGCDWAFLTAHKLRRHMEIHSNRKDFLCEVEGCGRKFTTIYNLNTHRKLHERPCTEMCTIENCGEKFQTKRQLDVHIAKVHADAEKNFKCPVPGCEKTFLSASCMGSHARVHQADRDLQCKIEGCGRVFDKHCRLQEHMRTHTGDRPYVCQEEGCGWSFVTSSKLKRHQRKHTGERRWRCPKPWCGKAFMRSEHLKGHMITHSGEKPFICPVQNCDARFTARSSLYVHVRKHKAQESRVQDENPGSGPITFFCPFDGCDKKYTNKSTFKSHLTKHYDAFLKTSEMNFPFASDEIDTLSVPGNEELQAEAAANSILAPDGATIIPTDLIDPNDESVVVSNGVVHVLSNVIVKPNATQNVPMEVVPSQPNNQSVIITMHPEEGGGGSARTDFKSNEVLSEKARRRRKLLKGNANNFELKDSPSQSSPVDCLVSNSGDSTLNSYNTGGLLTSQGITFRDPDTGTMYVQTQLLQDDPPHPDMYGDDGMAMDISDNSGLDADLPTSILLETDQTFTGTTINLQDLA